MSKNKLSIIKSFNFGVQKCFLEPAIKVGSIQEVTFILSEGNGECVYVGVSLSEFSTDDETWLGYNPGEYSYHLNTNSRFYDGDI